MVKTMCIWSRCSLVVLKDYMVNPKVNPKPTHTHTHKRCCSNLQREVMKVSVTILQLI